jgi:hypothetical protein
MIDPVSTDDRRKSRFRRVCEAIAYAARPEHLKSTVRIALVVGVVLTILNHADVIVSGDATVAIWVKCGLNFVVPFVVANLGLISGRAIREPEG